MAIIATLKNARFEKIQESPGKSQQVDLEGIGKGADDAEVYHPAGFYSKSVDGVIGAVVDAGDNNIVVATHNYNFNKDVDKGEALLYSIDKDGNILSTAKVDKNGNFVINDGAKSAVSHAELNTALQTMLTALNADIVVAGGVGSTTLDISSSEVDKVKLP